MGNIIGEVFKDYVDKQVNIRQNNLAVANRSTDLLLEQNAKSAWIKLTSSILIADRAKFDIPQDIPDLAKYFTLFGGTAINRTPIGGLGAYNNPKFGFEQGYRPAPGISSLETKNRNRGSVRETTIKLTAYSREQFYYIDLLYLRLGYSVLIEFGHSLYYDNSNTFQQFADSQTLTDAFLGAGEASDYKGNHLSLLTKIEERRKSTGGNYDAIFGQIRNFDWSFTPEGSYDITLSVISYGDVIESLKANTISDSNATAPVVAEKATDGEPSTEEQLQQAKTDEKVIELLKELDTVGNLFYNLKESLSLYGNKINNTETGAHTLNTLTSIAAFSAKDMTIVSDDEKYYAYDAIAVVGEGFGIGYHYYIRLGAFLQYLWEQGMIYVDADRTIPLLKLDNEVTGSFIYQTPYTVSSNPAVCIVKNKVQLIGQEGDVNTTVFEEIPYNGRFYTDNPKYPDAGLLMNVYVNMAYILKEANSIKDSKNKVFFYDLINKICKGIESSLGGVNTLEPVIDETECRLYIVDQHIIPSKQNEQPPGTLFNIYGVTPGDKGTFVQDFGIKTSITNALATTITIGAQAGGGIKGEDATAFSKWNRGLVDRVLIVKDNKSSAKDQKQADEALKVLANRHLATENEYITYVNNLKSYIWNQEKGDEFTSILSNIISFKENAKGLQENNTTGGDIGFLPINLNLTFTGLSGIKIYQKFRVENTFLPYNYPETLHFIVTGISHQIDGNKWITKIDTNAIPSTTIVNTGEVGTISRTGASSANGSTISSNVGTGTNTAPTTVAGNINYPAATASRLRLRLDRVSDNGIQTLGKLKVYAADGITVIYTIDTVERSWKGNANKISCIPPGTYRITKSKMGNHPDWGYLVHLSDPRHRAGVYIHTGTKPEHSEGCILVGAYQTGNIQKIMQALFPDGAPVETFKFEIYGVPNKSYVDVRDDTVYAGPTATDRLADTTEPSRKKYVEYANILNKVLNQNDAYDNGKPLLKAMVGDNDNEEGAVKRFKELVGLSTNPSVKWFNQVSLGALLPAHKVLFQEQFNILMDNILRANNTYVFRTPAVRPPTKYGSISITMKPDFGRK